MVTHRMNNDDINYTKEAFLNTWNLAFLAIAAGMALGTAMVPGTPEWLFELVLVLAGGLELVYLGIMPRTARFQRHVRSQKIAEKHKPPSQRELFSQLRNQSQRRYAKLRKLREEIQANYRKLSYASQGLLDSHLDKIDGLMESYLDLLHQRERHREFMDRSTEAQIRQSIQELKADMADDTERIREVKKRRLRVLKQRLARLHKANENLEIIGAQLGTIEDVVKYIHEQSWTMQSPEEISFQLDALLEEVEETQASIRQIEDVFGAPSDYLDDEVEDVEDLDAVREADHEAGKTDADLDADETLDLPSEEHASTESGPTPSSQRVRE
jgi:hypothetical protein